MCPADYDYSLKNLRIRTLTSGATGAFSALSSVSLSRWLQLMPSVCGRADARQVRELEVQVAGLREELGGKKKGADGPARGRGGPPGGRPLPTGRSRSRSRWSAS